MAGAAIYYYPRGATSFRTIDLSRLSDLIVEPHREVSDARALSGFTLRSDLGSWRGVRIIAERLTDAAEIRELRNLESHLRSGGRCAFVRDTDRAIAWRGSSTQAAGSLSLSLVSGSNVYPYNGSAALTSGDEISVEDVNPDHRLELVRYTSISGAKITIADGLTYGYTNQTVIRYADFYPVLWMPEDQARSGQPMLSEHRRNWTLDLQLAESPGEVNRVTSGAESLATSTRGTDGGGFTIEQIVNLDQYDLIAGLGFSPDNNWSPYGLG